MTAAEHLTPNAGSWDWIYYKTWLSMASGLSDDMLHLFGGLALLVLLAWLMRQRPWHWLPWLGVLVLECANETYDLTQTSYVTDEGNFSAAWHDLWMTMLWPTVILLTFGRLASRARAADAARRTETADGAADPGAAPADPD